MPMEAKTQISAAQAFRDVVASKAKLTDEEFIAKVRAISGSKTFNQAHLNWYRSMWKAGKLSKGRKQAKSN